eukprot:GHUV01008615.1.p1 GENE.GHUV01008615.1~~GHUV01008615.1.p1  ORF type:complete len:600 (+),score=182.10 GHUV01008615.1:310-2109(+)
MTSEGCCSSNWNKPVRGWPLPSNRWVVRTPGKSCRQRLLACNALSCMCLEQAFEVAQGAAQPSCSTAAGYMPGQTSSAVVRMESQLIFDSCWRRFKERHGMDFAAPREVIWLNGAPGSGKGVSTPHILKARGLTRSICMSSLLSSAAEARKFIDSGEMIADHVVGDLLLDALLLPVSDGVSPTDLNTVVDGFPRTAVQVDFLKLMMEKLRYLHTKYMDTPFAARFPRPTFKVVMLYVDEETSINRQMQRAELAQAHNRRVKDAGVGEQQLQEERSTDVAPEKARKRYQIFKQHYPAVLRLKQFFPFHLIDASYSLSDTQEQITQELRYQSSLDLGEETYSAIRHLPLAKDLQQTARQQLVSRLEGYCRQQRPLFGQVLGLVQQHVVPLLQQGALSGAAEWVSQHDLFTKHPVCIDMLLDVLSDRGFVAHYVQEVMAVPVNFNTVTGAITTRTQPLHRFRFTFDASGVRDASALKALEIAARITEAARSNIAAAQAGSFSSRPLPAAAPITESFIPEHLDLEAKMRAQDRSLKRVAMAGRSSSGAAVSSSCDGCSSGSTCTGHDSSSSSAAEGVFVIHRCLKPETNCGHAEELQVVAATG